MPTFEFDEGPTQMTLLTSGSPTTTLAIDGGVNPTFSFSMNVGGPGGSIVHLNPGGPDDAYLSGSASAGGGDVFSLSLTTGNITGDVMLNLTRVNGSVEVRMVGVSGASDHTEVLTTDGTVSATGNFTQITFTMSSSSYFFRVNDITADNIQCFCAGTRIATPDGPRRVETLQAGDRLSLADGGTTCLRWLGQSRVDPAAHHPAATAPVRIRAGALGQGRPARDLLLSPDHAIALDGRLVNAAALVDGTTITRDRRTEPFTYYHLETDAHELILAEGVPAETYLEHLAPQSFDNARHREARVVPEMPLPRVTSARLLPDSLRARDNAPA